MSRHFVFLCIAASAVITVLIASKMSQTLQINSNNSQTSNHSLPNTKATELAVTIQAAECLSFRLLERNARFLQWTTSKPISCEITLEEFLSALPPSTQNMRIYAADGVLLWTMYRPVGEEK
jgi:hypothetical protein